MSTDTFKFRCEACNHKLSATSDISGQRIRCPHCTKPITIPFEAVFMESATAAIESDEIQNRKQNMSVPQGEVEIEQPSESTKPTKQIKISDTFRLLFQGKKKKQ